MKQPTLLWIDCCIRGKQNSRTMELCDFFLTELLQKQSYSIEKVTLAELSLLPYDNERLMLRDRLIQQNRLDDPIFEYAHQFAQADIILLGAPYWDLSFPSLLKVYIEHIMATNVTFHYIKGAPVGLCRAKQLYYITTAGGYIQNQNFGYEYIRGLAQMLGIGQTSFFSAQGLDIQGNLPQNILEETKKNISLALSSICSNSQI